jgi:hypothetical protein
MPKLRLTATAVERFQPPPSGQVEYYDTKHPTDLAMLRGVRLVTASETEEGRAWAEARIKQMTGGDPISARFMRQDFFTYVPQFKLTIVGNHKPTLQNVDDAVRRRFNIIPFIRKPAAPDKQLEEKLRAEWRGILRWMIDGCLDWQAHGLIRPVSVTEATETYFSDQDLLAQFLDEMCDCDPENQSKFESSAKRPRTRRLGASERRSGIARPRLPRPIGLGSAQLRATSRNPARGSITCRGSGITRGRRSASGPAGEAERAGWRRAAR